MLTCPSEQPAKLPLKSLAGEEPAHRIARAHGIPPSAPVVFTQVFEVKRTVRLFSLGTKGKTLREV